MRSKQANEINISKESKADSTGIAKEGQDPIFLVLRLRKRVSKKGRKAQRSEKMERGGNQYP